MSSPISKRQIIFIGAVFFFLTLTAISLYKGVMELKSRQSRLIEAQAKVGKLQVQKQKLEQTYLQDESFMVETEIRDKLGLSKPGERIIFIPEQEEATQAASEEKKEKSWWEWWR